MYQHNPLLKMSYLLILLFPVFLQAQTTDLELTMTSNNPQVGIYDYITVTTTLQNTGTQSVDNAIVNFDIPTGVAIAGEFPPNAEQGNHEGFFGGSSEGNWFVGEVAAGESLTFEVTYFTLSENNTTFYGQVAQGGNNDPDSTPGNGTCCTANEDDEAAYTFPNDDSDCTFDQAYAELICDDNGTPDDASDDKYVLRFRADGSEGEYSLLIPTLSYFQTFEYSSGFTQTPQFSLEVETLELIFSDAEDTEGCGETINLTVPACAVTDCEIVYNEISNTIDDMGTPDNLFDDTFTIVYTIENAGGGTGFVGQFGGQFCGQVPSTGTYGEEITFTANVSNWGNGSTVGCQIVDNENPNCTGGYTLLPDVACGFGNVCADLELSAANTPTPIIYEDAYTQFVLENDFLGEEATGIQVTFSKNELNIVGVPMVSQGSIDLYWTDNPVWNVGTLAPNQVATIDFDLYTIASNYSLYGEVSAQNENDFDSTPNNGNGSTPVEDDEALYSNGDGNGPLADLVPGNLNISNSPIIAGNILYYSFDVSNQGEIATSTSSSIRAWISTDNVLSESDLEGGQVFSNSAILPGQTINIPQGQSSILNTLPDGDYFLIIEVDEFDGIQESNESNNTTAAPFTIGNEVSCDLIISNTDLTCASTTVNSDFVYSIEVIGAAGNTVNYEVLGTNFGGTIVTGQLVAIATLPQGTDFTVVVTDQNNAGCDYILTSNIPVAPGICFEEGDGADVILSASNNQNPPVGIYQSDDAVFTLTNTGTTAATGLTVTFTKNQVNVTGIPTTTAGTAQFHWTDNPVWNVGTLAAGQSEIIVFPIFTVDENYSLYGEVTAMAEEDSDSTPNNGNGSTPVEDDEALWPTGTIIQTGLPDFVLDVTDVGDNFLIAGEDIDFSLIVRNEGGFIEENDVYLNSYFSTDDELSDDDILAESEFIFSSLIPGGMTPEIATSATIPTEYLSGNYYLIIKVDGFDNVDETNNANNIIPIPVYVTGNNPEILIEVLDLACSNTEGFYDVTIQVTANSLQNPPMQSYTVFNGEFLGVHFGPGVSQATFTDIPLGQVSTIEVSDSSGPGEASLTIDPPLDCGLIDEGNFSIDVEVPQNFIPIFSTFSATVTITNETTEPSFPTSVYIAPIDGLVFEGGNEYTATHGELVFFSSNWDLPSLAPGETAVLTMNYFTTQAGEKEISACTYCFFPDREEDSETIFVQSNLTEGGNSIIESADETVINLFPNPVQDLLSVEILSEDSNAVDLRVLSVTGTQQIYREFEGVKGTQTVKIPVADLERGVYLLSIRQGEEIVVKRFVKM